MQIGPSHFPKWIQVKPNALNPHVPEHHLRNPLSDYFFEAERMGEIAEEELMPLWKIVLDMPHHNAGLLWDGSFWKGPKFIHDDVHGPKNELLLQLIKGFYFFLLLKVHMIHYTQCHPQIYLTISYQLIIFVIVFQVLNVVWNNIRQISQL